MPRPLGIVLLGALDDRILEEVVTTVREKLGTDVSVLGRTSCEAGFDGRRRQWRADVMINQCMRKFSSPSRFCVGLTGADLYMPGLNFIFGLAVREGLGIVSWHRLQDEEGRFTIRLAKEVIHEVGHLEGLDHCSDETCVMWFSNTLRETDKKKADFCPTCRLKRTKGQGDGG